MVLVRSAIVHDTAGSVRLTRLSSKIGQEVNDQVEEDRVDDLVWQIGKHGSESLGRRVVAGLSIHIRISQRVGTYKAYWTCFSTMFR